MDLSVASELRYGAVSRLQSLIYFGFALLLVLFLLSPNIGAFGPTRRNILPGSLYANSAGPLGAPTPKNCLALCTPASSGMGRSWNAIVAIRSLLSTSHSALPASCRSLNLPHLGITHCSLLPALETKYISLPPDSMMGHSRQFVYPGELHPALGKRLRRRCSKPSRSGSPLPQTTTVTRWPVNGSKALTNESSPLSSSLQRGPWASTSPSRCPIVADASSSLLSIASAFSPTASASSWAVLAEVAASPAACVNLVSIWCRMFRRSPSTREASYETRSSPATPIVTRIPPISPFKFVHGNLAIGQRTSTQKCFTSSQYSTTSPITTIAVESNNISPQKSSDSSRALEALSSADSSIECDGENKAQSPSL